MTAEPAAPDPRRAGRRQLALAAGLGLAGGALGAVGAGREWATATAPPPGPADIAASGADVAPLALPLALVALASWGAFLVLRLTGRRVVAVLGLLAGAGGAVAALVGVGRAGEVAAGRLSDAGAATTSTTAWPWMAAIGLALAAACSAYALVKGRDWPQMSRRYDRAGTDDEVAAGSGAMPVDLWKAIDEGRDPTV